MKSLDRFIKVVITTAVSATCGVGGVVNAQGLVLEELVVTARKVEESIQVVPIAITAFTADDIEKQSIEELEDVALLTPGLSFEDYSNGGFGTPIIRGASQFSVDALTQNVSTFIDGVYIPRNYALDLGAANMERIEVVKGPQGALYGANSFMGAINYVTSQANLSEMMGNVGVTLGDDGRQDLSASISVPIVADKLAIKVAASTSEYDGGLLNSHPAAGAGVNPGVDESLGGWDKDTLSLSLVAQPTDSVRIELGYQTFDTLTEGGAQSRLELGDLNCGGTLFFGPLRGYCGELPETPLAPGTTDEVGFLIDPRTYGLDAETDIFRAALSADLTDNISVSYQYSKIEGDVFSAGISDRNPLTGQDLTAFGLPGFFNAFTVLPVGGFEADSHELRFEFNTDSGIYAMLGAYKYDGEDRDTGQGGFFAPLYTTNLDPITEASLLAGSRNNNITETESTAIFGRVAVPLIDDKLTVSVEGRYTDDTTNVNIDYIDGTSSAPFEDSYFTPRLSLDYSISDSNLIYFSAAKGVKTGGLNAEILGGLTAAERTYGPDENTTIELGSKNTLLDGRMQLNATLYNIDWSDLQVSQAAINGGFFTTSITGNLGEATSKGLELDMRYSLTDAFTLNLGLALNDATYDDGVISQRLDRANICDDIVCRADGDISGNSLPRSSDTQWNIGGQYDGSTSGGINYFIRADVTGQSEQYMSEANITTLPSRSIINLRAGLSKDNWSAQLWVKNAGDEEYVSNAFYIPSPFFVAIVPTWGTPRRIGVTFDYSF